MTPTERIEAISRRFHDRNNPAPRARRSREHLELARAAKTRHRLARLESEREDWVRLIHETGGVLKWVAQRMGVDEKTARRAIQDLGLWPELAKVRTERKFNNG